MSRCLLSQHFPLLCYRFILGLELLWFISVFHCKFQSGFPFFFLISGDRMAAKFLPSMSLNGGLWFHHLHPVENVGYVTEVFFTALTMFNISCGTYFSKSIRSISVTLYAPVDSCCFRKFQIVVLAIPSDRCLFFSPFSNGLLFFCRWLTLWSSCWLIL